MELLLPLILLILTVTWFADSPDGGGGVALAEAPDDSGDDFVESDVEDGDLSLEQTIDIVGDEIGLETDNRISDIPRVDPTAPPAPPAAAAPTGPEPVQVLKKFGFADDFIAGLAPEMQQQFAGAVQTWWATNVQQPAEQLREQANRVQQTAQVQQDVQGSSEWQMAGWLISHPNWYEHIQQLVQGGQPAQNQYQQPQPSMQPTPQGQPGMQQPGYGQAPQPANLPGWEEMTESERSIATHFGQQNEHLGQRVQQLMQHNQAMQEHGQKMQQWAQQHSSATRRSIDQVTAGQLKSEWAQGCQDLVRELGFDPQQTHAAQWQKVVEYAQTWIRSAKMKKEQQNDHSPVTGIPIRQLLIEGSRAAGLYDVAAKRKEEAATSAPAPNSRSAGAQTGPRDLSEIIDAQARAMGIQ